MNKFVVICMLLVAVACRKDHAAPALKPCVVDPCLCANETTAEFKVYEGYYGNPAQSETFDFRHISLEEPGEPGGTSIELHALETDANCTFIIGNDTFAGPYFTKGFGSSENTPGDSLKITLIVEKEANTTCFPHDDGRDTVSKWIYFSVEFCEPLWEGSFEGVLESNPTDTFVVDLEDYNITPGSCSGSTKISNMFNQGCVKTYGGSSSNRTTRKVYFENNVFDCLLKRGWAEVPMRNNDSIYITAFPFGSNQAEIFKGKRLP